jgi:hypothetical protein
MRNAPLEASTETNSLFGGPIGARKVEDGRTVGSGTVLYEPPKLDLSSRRLAVASSLVCCPEVRPPILQGGCYPRFGLYGLPHASRVHGVGTGKGASHRLCAGRKLERTSRRLRGRRRRQPISAV